MGLVHLVGPFSVLSFDVFLLLPVISPPPNLTPLIPLHDPVHSSLLCLLCFPLTRHALLAVLPAQAAAADKGNAELAAASKAEIAGLMKVKEELAKAEEA